MHAEIKSRDRNQDRSDKRDNTDRRQKQKDRSRSRERRACMAGWKRVVGGVGDDRIDSRRDIARPAAFHEILDQQISTKSGEKK